jgi:hypothetical protein
MITYQYEVPPPYIPSGYRDGMRGLAGGIFGRGDSGLGVLWFPITSLDYAYRDRDPYSAAREAIELAKLRGNPSNQTVTDWHLRVSNATLARDSAAAKAVFDEAYGWVTGSQTAKDIKEAYSDLEKKAEVPMWLKAAGVVVAIGVIGYTVRAFK